MAKDKTNKPVILCILDGWGNGNASDDNAIINANTPFFDKLNNNAIVSELATSGLAVGLPEGQMGNSEVGHMNIGGGRVVMQNLPKINKSFAEKSISENQILLDFVKTSKQNTNTIHLLGLISPGGVHSHIDHIIELAKILAKQGLSVKVHAFLDGRDVAQTSAIEFVEQFNEAVAGLNIQIVTATGRYYSMDRDNKYDRVKLAYDAIFNAVGEKTISITDSINKNYQEKIYDEFIEPIILDDYDGFNDGDAILMANFRSDRVRQILTAIADPEFDQFAKSDKNISAIIGMVEYSDRLNNFVPCLFPSEKLSNNLGEVISKAGLNQLRIAETEKYAHVTFFFNSGREELYKNEDRILVDSPDVKTYDLQPQMSAFTVTDKLLSAIKSNKYDLIVVNFANTDMVGHTGNYEAAVKAVETIDECLEKLVTTTKEAGGAIFITADHGNSEQMKDKETNKPYTSHTTNNVPFILAGDVDESLKLKQGALCDIAPTILKLMKINQPDEMTGEALLYE